MSSEIKPAAYRVSIPSAPHIGFWFEDADESPSISGYKDEPLYTADQLIAARAKDQARIAELEAQLNAAIIGQRKLERVQGVLAKALKKMLKQFTKTPSTVKDSEARAEAHAALAAVQKPCQTCNGHGMVGGHVGQTPEQFDYVSEPCPDCAEPKRYFWGRPGEELFRMCDSLEDAHAEAQAYINEHFEPGRVGEYEVGEAVPALVNEDSEVTRREIADNIIEHLDMWAGEQTGAEEETFDVTPEERDELGNLVMDFILLNANHQWFTSKPGTVTQHTHAAAPQPESGAA